MGGGIACLLYSYIYSKDVTRTDHIRNVDLYGDLPRVTDNVRGNRPELVASKLTLSKPGVSKT